MNRISKLATATTAAALAAVVTGCGSNGSSGGSAAGQQPTNAAATTLTTASTTIGSVLVNSQGHTVYELVGNTASHSTCPKSCQAYWPPVMANGSQLVVNGHPVFSYAADAAAGQVKGQGVTDSWGRWWALDASGNPITTSPAPATSPSTGSTRSGGGGGYGY